MKRDARRLDDILQVARKITARAHDGRERFDHDEERQAAFERWPRIVAMRNRLVHDYLNIDQDILWDVVSVDIPALAERIAAIVEDLESGGWDGS